MTSATANYFRYLVERQHVHTEMAHTKWSHLKPSCQTEPDPKTTLKPQYWAELEPKLEPEKLLLVRPKTSQAY